jgi:hypothetical protein
MDLEMVLNELSLLTPAADILTARQRMSELLSTIRQATASGVKRVLRTSEDINTIELVPSYPIARWRNDGEVDLEERRFFLALTTKAPFWTDVAEEIKGEFDLSEIWHQGRQAGGLGFALIIDGLAISFQSDECWHCHCLQLEVRRLDEDCNVIEERVEIVHASHGTHVLQHAAWIENRIRTLVSDGEELWIRKDEFFPNLEFCETVSKQLQSIRTGQLELKPVVRALFELQNCCKNWTIGAFSTEEYAIEESGESEATLKKYRKERTFQCPDGQDRLFERHIKLRLCNWRIHFLPVQPGKAIVGYIGRHLPTVKYKT